MRGPAGRGEGAPPSALTLPPPPKPEGTPFPPRGGSRGGGKETAWPGGSGLQEHGPWEAMREGLSPRGDPAGPGGVCPRGPSGTVTASPWPGDARSPRVLGDPSQGGCEDASFCALYVRGTCISSLFSLCIALGCLRFLFRE